MKPKVGIVRLTLRPNVTPDPSPPSSHFCMIANPLDIVRKSTNVIRVKVFQHYNGFIFAKIGKKWALSFLVRKKYILYVSYITIHWDVFENCVFTKVILPE